MNIGQGYFPILSPQQNNPIMGGLTRGLLAAQQFQENRKRQMLMPFVTPNAQQQLLSSSLANQRNQATLPYAGPQAAAQLQNAQLTNKWFDPRMRAQIAVEQAQAGNLGADTRRTNFMLANPGFMGGDASKEIAALQAMGVIPKQGASGGSPQMQPSQGAPSMPGLPAPQPQMGVSVGAQQAQIAPNQTQNIIPPLVGANAANQQQTQGAPSQGLAQALAQKMQSQQNVPRGMPQQQPMQQGMPGNILSGPQSEPFKTGNPSLDALLNKPYGKAAYDQQMAQAFSYVHAPVEAKAAMLAQLRGMGIDTSEANQMLSSGQTIPQIATQKGFDPNNLPQPDFLAGQKAIDTLKQRQAALAEAKVIDQFVSDGLGPYSRTIGGMSPVQIGQAISGQNPDGQAKFLAARALAPESAQIRVMLANGKAGEGIVQQLMNKSMQNANAYQSLVSPDVYKKSQDLILSKLEEAFGEASKTYGENTNSKGAQSSSQGGKPTIKLKWNGSDFEQVS